MSFMLLMSVSLLATVLIMMTILPMANCSSSDTKVILPRSFVYKPPKEPENPPSPLPDWYMNSIGIPKEDHDQEHQNLVNYHDQIENDDNTFEHPR
jgi:hypothetical protein